MAAFAPNVNASRAMRASIGLPQSSAQVDAHSDSSTGIAARPSVEISPGEPVKRLGTGWHWWFSESVHVPAGHQIEFRFQGPAHLLVLYNEGLRRGGETSIDGQQMSRLRSLAHKLTFVPSGRAYREWHETGSSTRLTFLYLHPRAFHGP